MLEVKFKSNMNGVIKEIAIHAAVDTASFETLHIQPKELSAGKFTDINEANWLWWCPWGSDTSKNFTLKKLLEIFDNTEKEKGKMLEAYSYLGRNMTIC